MDRCNVGVIRVRGVNGQDFVLTVRMNRFKTVRTKQKICPYEKTPFRRMDRKTHVRVVSVDTSNSCRD